jgi:hypothetical protein
MCTIVVKFKQNGSHHKKRFTGLNYDEAKKQYDEWRETVTVSIEDFKVYNDDE